MMNRKNLQRILLGEFSVQRMFKSLIFIYVSLCVWAFFFSDTLIFRPQPTSYQDSPEILKITADDGVKISAIYLPHPQAKYTLLYSHGNGEDLGDIRSVLESLQQMGFAVFAYDYRGYGTSQGTPSEQNSYRDVDSAYHYLTQKLGIPPNQIIAYGRSVGGAMAVDLAARQPVAGLILESPFTKAFLALTRVPIVPFDKFANIDKIKQVRCPVLVMHSRTDEVIPFAHGQQMFAAAGQPKRSLWINQGGHNDLPLVAAKEYQAAMIDFVQLVARTPAGAPKQ